MDGRPHRRKRNLRRCFTFRVLENTELLAGGARPPLSYLPVITGSSHQGGLRLLQAGVSRLYAPAPTLPSTPAAVTLCTAVTLPATGILPAAKALSTAETLAAAGILLTKKSLPAMETLPIAKTLPAAITPLSFFACL